MKSAVHTPLLLLALALACAPAGTASTPEAGTAERPLRVMSYNIHAGTGGLDRIAAVIREQTPDLVGLQEVDVHFSPRSDFVDQARALADATDMQVRFAHIYELDPDSAGAPPREYGVALLSRHPIRAFRNHEISRLSTVVEEAEPKPRPGFLEAVVEIGGQNVRLFNTHLDYRGDPRVRRAQVAEMLEIIGSASSPTILVGDLNAEPGADELQPLLQRLRDAWANQTTEGLTFPADTPVKRIDYVLHSSHFSVDTARVLSSHASDHLPVVADLVLQP